MHFITIPPTVSVSDPKIIRDPAFRKNWKAEQLYEAEPNGHKFKVGDVATLTGLTDFPEFNGKTVKITAVRDDGPRGKALLH